MTEWLLSLNVGPIFGTLILIVALCALVGIFDAIARPWVTRSRARIAEANARTAEAKARRAELIAMLQPPQRPEPSTAEQMAATPDHPALRKSPRGGLADVPD